MPARRDLLVAACSTAVAATGGCLGGRGGPAPSDGAPGSATEETMSTDLSLSTPAFEDGTSVPETHTCDGADVSPELRVGDVPEGTASLALVVDDPDAPGGTFVHWLLWNLPPDVGTVPEGVPTSETVADLGGARQGTNGFGEVGYRGPCPPAGDGPHTYRFTLHALSGSLSLSAGADRDALDEALDGATLARARLTGEYER